MTMDDTEFYIVYNRRPMLDLSYGGMNYIPAGYSLTAYPDEREKIVFKGNYYECQAIGNILLNLNFN